MKENQILVRCIKEFLVLTDLCLVDREPIVSICSYAISGDKVACIWMKDVFAKLGNETHKQKILKYTNCHDVSVLTDFIEVVCDAMKQFFDKCDVRGTFLFNIQQTIYFYKAFHYKVDGIYSDQQIIIMTGLMVCLPYIENSPDIISAISDLIMNVFKGKFAVGDIEYCLDEYDFSNLENATDIEIVSRLCFANYIILRMAKKLEEIVEIPIIGHEYIEQVVLNNFNDNNPLLMDSILDLVDKYLTVNANNMEWLEKYRDEDFF